jgi:hypothetical protein
MRILEIRPFGVSFQNPISNEIIFKSNFETNDISIMESNDF